MRTRVQVVHAVVLCEQVVLPSAEPAYASKHYAVSIRVTLVLLEWLGACVSCCACELPYI
jgi:hypothetical protein